MSRLWIGLSAVIVAADGRNPQVLATRRDDGSQALPFGAFEPVHHRTLERGLRAWVREQTGFDLGYAEQLYTFGDKDRETPEASLADVPKNAHIISVGYLALTPEEAPIEEGFVAKWRNWYSFFPWEDHRVGRPEIIDALITPRLLTWAAGNEQRQSRVRLAFGVDDAAWIEERVLERYELLYEAGLVEECARDAGLPFTGPPLGRLMASDHRRILATAMGRLRGKLKYRPVVFELMGETFTLSALQNTVESLLGLRLHKQNFRRALDRAGLVEGTGQIEARTGGRPAELYTFRRDILNQRMVSGLSTPGLKQG